ncbi:MAG: hypothetical protein ACRD3T_21175 [Terriglobia bacterium]
MVMVPQDVLKIALQWGPGVLILLVFAYGFIRLAHHWIDKTMELKREQLDGTFRVARDYVDNIVGAQKSQAEAIARLASSMEHRESFEGYEHQEMLVALKAIHQNVQFLVSHGTRPEELDA